MVGRYQAFCSNKFLKQTLTNEEANTEFERFKEVDSRRIIRTGGEVATSIDVFDWLD